MKDLVNRCIDDTRDNGSTHPTQFFALNSLNVMVSVLFGKKFESVKDSEFIQLSDIIEESMALSALEKDLANFLPVLSVYDYLTGTKNKMKHHINNNRNPIYQKLIREASTREGPNAIKSLKENGFHLSEEDILVFMCRLFITYKSIQVLICFKADLVVAGVDTVKITLSWNIAIMCNHPDVQKKVSAEIDKFIKLNGHLPHFDEREQIPYCISVIKECMRYKPTTPFGLIHVTRKDCKFNNCYNLGEKTKFFIVDVDGYVILKGSNILSNMESMHRRPEIYTEPEKFIPERFMNNTKTMQSAANGKVEDRDHYNFGWGRYVVVIRRKFNLFIYFLDVFVLVFI